MEFPFVVLHWVAILNLTESNLYLLIVFCIPLFDHGFFCIFLTYKMNAEYTFHFLLFIIKDAYTNC